MSLATTTTATTTPGEVPSQRVIVVSWQPDRTFRTISELRNPPIDVSELNNISSLANFKALKLRETFGQVYGGRNKKITNIFFCSCMFLFFFLLGLQKIKWLKRRQHLSPVTRPSFQIKKCVFNFSSVKSGHIVYAHLSFFLIVISDTLLMKKIRRVGNNGLLLWCYFAWFFCFWH